MRSQVLSKYSKLGLVPYKFVLPSSKYDGLEWSVVAVDQYTSQKQYWEEVDAFIGDKPSTRHMVLPELYLDQLDKSPAVLDSIVSSMKRYIAEGVVKQTATEGVMYVERVQRNGERKHGIMLALDLESYDFVPGNSALTRATEGTIVERIPPRLKIRKAAALEVPHVILLNDDLKDKLIQNLASCTRDRKPTYDVKLMQNSGSVKGWFVDDETSLSKLYEDFEASKHGGLLTVVGDGNHSLAAAKALWNDVKSSLSADAQHDHPLRFALVEIQNIHQESMRFEPIHRLIEGRLASGGNLPETLRKDFVAWLTKTGQTFTEESLKSLKSPGSKSPSVSLGNRSPRSQHAASGATSTASHSDADIAAPRSPKSDSRSPRSGDKGSGSPLGSTSGNTQVIEFRSHSGVRRIIVTKPKKVIAAATVTDFLDPWLKDHKEIHIDYVHGEEAIDEKIRDSELFAGIVLPGIPKSALFETVQKDGILPRKSFSIGHAEDKRFYREARALVGGLAFTSD